MIGWILYDKIGAQRNRWFIQSFLSAAAKRGVELVLKIVDPATPLSKDGPLPDFAIVRTIAPHINRYLESHNVPTFNNFETSKIANNKWLTYQLCEKLQIPTMKTYLLSNAEKLAFPLVLKSFDGHGGTEVFLIHDSHALAEKKRTIQADRFLVQEFCSDPGKDVRVYVLGEQILAGILRTSTSDFRSNFSLGGSVCVTDILPEQAEIIHKLRQALGFDLVGVDFIFHNGAWVLNEIEDVVGTRMLYKCTDIDIVDLYMEYIVKHVASNS